MKRREPCTGIAAQWCPNHGTCTCPETVDDGGSTHRQIGSDLECPLHGMQSNHIPYMKPEHATLLGVVEPPDAEA